MNQTPGENIHGVQASPTDPPPQPTVPPTSSPASPTNYGPGVYQTGLYGYRPAAVMKEPYGFARPDGAFALLMAVLGFLFIKFILLGGGGISVTIYTVMYAFTLLGYMRVRKVETRPVVLAYVTVILVVGSYFGLMGGGPLSVFTIFFLIALSAYTVSVYCGSRTEDSLRYVVSDTCTALFITPFAHFDAGPRAIRHNTRNRMSIRVLYAALGVVLAIPLFVFIGSLLGSADALFQRLWEKLVETIFNRLHIHVVQFAFGLPVAMYLFGLFYGSLRRRAQPRTTEHAEARARSLRAIPLPLAMGVVIPLLLLYVLFFASQVPYLTSAFRGMTPVGITQADYARRGFFELCWVCSINMGVLIGLYYFTKSVNSKEGSTALVGSGRFAAPGHPAKVCAILLCVFSMALSVISLSKMLLYIQDLGLTRKRIYTSFFMVFLFAAFGLTIAGLLRKRFATAKWVTLTGTVLLLILCFMNADGLIVRHNISRYQQNKVEKLDVYPMRELGEAAVKPLAELLDTNPELERDILQVLSDIYERSSGDWRSFTLTRLQSRRVLEGIKDRLEPYSRWTRDYHY